MGEEKLVALIQESLAAAARTQALRPKDLARVVVDTTVQPKAVMFPTDARLIDRARTRLVRLAKKLGIELRQSYARVGKRALIKHQRYAHAKQFRRAKRALRKLRTYLGCQSAPKFDPSLECAPDGGQNHAAVLTVCRVC
jgi:IS5 family transposase